MITPDLHIWNKCSLKMHHMLFLEVDMGNNYAKFFVTVSLCICPNL